MTASRWYVVQTHPHAEKNAVSHLMRQGFSTYLPCYQKKRRHARRIERVTAALFPRYLFVALDIDVQRWRCISSTIGVSRLICVSDVPTAVPDQVIENLKRQEDSDGFIQLEKQRFNTGDKIRLQDGGLADCLGIYEGMKDHDRVAVLLDLLGRKVRVFVDVESLMPAA